ncbi:MAG: hypothetical protein HYV77_01315 [Candidatus Wildermuthbacteria bacterium]|nr:hypothetical protein [Candidatus Wildermuthbacteria bacterium]
MVSIHYTKIGIPDDDFEISSLADHPGCFTIRAKKNTEISIQYGAVDSTTTIGATAGATALMCDGTIHFTCPGWSVC